jgi:hypothetical protein
MTHKLVALETIHVLTNVLCLVTRYAIRLDLVDRITFYSGIVCGLAPIRTDLAAQMRADDFPELTDRLT